MVHIETWMETLTGLLRRQFAQRLCFVGLQGSYRRGEATENSDIDVVVIIDRMRPGDLEAYRDILRRTPHGEKACGFVCDRETFAAWPAHEVFHFARDTVACHGNLLSLLPAFDEADIRRALGIEASGLYHAAVHALLFDDGAAQIEALRALCKSALFALQLKIYVEHGVYHDRAAALMADLSGEDQDLLGLRLNWERQLPRIETAPDEHLQRIIGWSGGLLRSLAR